MKLIKANDAYANTLLVQQKAKQNMFNKFEAHFNKLVTDTANLGETAFALEWKEFDTSEELAINEDLMGALLDYIVLAGYEVELCYNSPSAFNPCGIVVAWGEKAEEDISVVFDLLDGLIWRGE